MVFVFLFPYEKKTLLYHPLSVKAKRIHAFNAKQWSTIFSLVEIFQFCFSGNILVHFFSNKSIVVVFKLYLNRFTWFGFFSFFNSIVIITIQTIENFVSHFFHFIFILGRLVDVNELNWMSPEWFWHTFSNSNSFQNRFFVVVGVVVVAEKSISLCNQYTLRQTDRSVGELKNSNINIQLIIIHWTGLVSLFFFSFQKKKWFFFVANQIQLFGFVCNPHHHYSSFLPV